MIRTLAVNPKAMLVDVTIGVQRPDQVDTGAVKGTLPHGKVTVDVVKGGLDIPDDVSGDVAVIASAAVAVKIELG
jgi:uncharacterized protein (TIGR02058 family)